MKYRVIGKSQVKLTDSAFANVGDEVTDKQVGANAAAYIELGMIEPMKKSKAAKTADVKSDEWTGKMSPETYLKRYPKGPKAKLAKKLTK